MSIHVFGIRHHGPGCARALRAALDELKPDILLIEGPPDAEHVLPLLTKEEMKPPVALLVYAADKPNQAVFFPFTHFSPEWQALTYGMQHNVPARFMDLPHAIHFARQRETDEENHSETPIEAEDEHKSTQSVAVPQEAEQLLQDDPLAMLSYAAGYEDHEGWWEQQIEQRLDTTGLFEGILEAMTELRSGRPPKNEEEALREAYMRQTIKAASKEGFQRIAVVCGAWHAPVLVDPEAHKGDTSLLKGLKKVKVEATWIPWTNSRLSYRSGYGAGIYSPGWYEHLWAFPGNATPHWMARAAHLLREQGMDASSASVIEAVRLAESLAALRDMPQPGLADAHEAILTVLCHGEQAPMNLIREKMEIGERMGTVPSDAPVVPLQRDLEMHQRRLRLKPSTEIVTLDLDLRKETDLGRSQLLHRLQLLHVPWGTPVHVSGKSGTFHEYWRLQWKVDFVIALIEANVWGNTIAEAAAAYAIDQARNTESLPTLTSLLNECILATLPRAVEQLLQELQKRAAVTADIHHLMRALPPLTTIVRYGDVRNTRADFILPIIQGLFERIVIGLPGACSSLDNDAAKQMIESINQAQSSVALLEIEALQEEWYATLKRIMEDEQIHGLVRGRCCRILLDQQILPEEELQRLTGLTLSPAVPATQAAFWIEGILQGSGLVMLHQDNLWRVLDGWVSMLTTDTFTQLLPILRRAFSGFASPERRAMGEKIKHLHTQTTQPTKSVTGQSSEASFDAANARLVLPTLAQILGVTFDDR
ncbi:hypothetical protein EI42_05510 [Thermosporothrix hazakensis]|uniref:Uncharacterized protein n=1 Tax=Thermosporothrix hazakensis TaxID=644383 RepID=A0A326TZL9_THEHA|nr:DUF5682 family protein [Thermosporothrix hazakensis]PZW22377.1 hypothetical protein EI42_05510 [Thermosporothrix hazakensis]GCE49130.1 hypothetical protein KTH_39990 [Thermosporothrix hazakensis]